MKTNNEVRQTAPPLAGRSNERMVPRQRAPWELLQRLAAAIQDFNINHPEDEVTAPVVRPSRPK